MNFQFPGCHSVQQNIPNYNQNVRKIHPYLLVIVNFFPSTVKVHFGTTGFGKEYVVRHEKTKRRRHLLASSAILDFDCSCVAHAHVLKLRHSDFYT
jgi:hypothetical protein